MHVGRWQSLAHGLSLATFFLFCWVIFRGLEVRTHCLNSHLVRSLRLPSTADAPEVKIDNCALESRLSLTGRFQRLSREQQQTKLQIEELDGLSDLFRAQVLSLDIEISEQPFRVLVQSSGVLLQIPSAFMKSSSAFKRAAILALLKLRQPLLYEDHFHQEILADLLELAQFGVQPKWSNVKLHNVPLSPREYCRSAWRSLYHSQACEQNDHQSLQEVAGLWGLRPLLSIAVWKVLTDDGTLKDRWQITQAILGGVVLPSMNAPALDPAMLAQWLRQHVEQIALVLGNSSGTAVATAADTETKADADADADVDADADAKAADRLARVFKRLDVESPVRWELTVDLQHMPDWRGVLNQLIKRAAYRPQERVLVFTPEGEVALPANVPVAWRPEQIRSQKHLLLACHWPEPARVLSIESRVFKAHQACTAPPLGFFW
jgi:hypothetical protein